jgi:hypothetical protein
MHGAQISAEQKVEVQKQLTRYQPRVVLAAINRWVEKRNWPVEDLRAKWKFWLEECAPHLQAIVTEEHRAKQVVGIEQRAAERAFATKFNYKIPTATAPQPGGIEDFLESK